MKKYYCHRPERGPLGRESCDLPAGRQAWRSILKLIDCRATLWLAMTAALFASLFFLPVQKCFASQDLVINEIMANPNTGDIEWIEIYNPGASDISILPNQYTIEDGTNSPKYIAGNTIVAGGYLVLYKGTDFTFGLNNDGETIILKDSGGEIDKVYYGNWASADQTKNAPTPVKGKTLARFPNGIDTGDDSDDFIIMMATPGAENIKPTFPNDLQITEIYPKPASGVKDEFVEIYNSGSSDIDLTDWSIDDDVGGSSPYLLSGTIKTGEYQFFRNSVSGISLNDDGDTARLLDPNGDVKSSVVYLKAQDDQSYSYDGSGWNWSTTVTPGAVNVITAVQLMALSDQSILISIGDARLKKDDEYVWVKGVVTVLPGTLSEQYFYIEDATAGIQIYSYYKAFPALELGQIIEVRGILSGAESDRRIKISDPGNITITEEPKIKADPKLVDISKVGEETEGQYVTIKGKIKNPSGSTFYVESGGKSVKVVINSKTKINKPRLKTGQSIEVSGIVSEYRGVYRILPTRQDDVKVMYRGGYELPETGPKDSLYLSLVISFVLWIIYLTIWEKPKNLPRKLP